MAKDFLGRTIGDDQPSPEQLAAEQGQDAGTVEQQVQQQAEQREQQDTETRERILGTGSADK